MGVCLGLSFDPELPEAAEAFETDGKCLVSELSTIDEICHAANVLPLSAFVDMSAYDLDEEELEGIPEEFRPDVEPGHSEEAEPRDCSEILTTVAAVISHLESKSSQATTFSQEDADAVLEDLKLLRRALEIGVTADARCMLFLW